MSGKAGLLTSMKCKPSPVDYSVQINFYVCFLNAAVKLVIRTGADYGLDTIGTCLGHPPAGGPPSDQKKRKSCGNCEKRVLKMTRMGDIVGCTTLFVNHN